MSAQQCKEASERTKPRLLYLKEAIPGKFYICGYETIDPFGVVRRFLLISLYG